MTKREWRRRQAVAQFWLAKMRALVAQGRPASPPSRFMQTPLWANYGPARSGFTLAAKHSPCNDDTENGEESRDLGNFAAG